METLAYAVRLAWTKQGGYVVTCRDLPEVVTQGNDIDDALAQASDAMDEAFAARIDDGEEFPKPSPVRKGEHLVVPSSDMSAKAALYVAMQEAAMSKAQLTRALQLDEKEVRRLLDPRHRSKLSRIEDALRALGKRFVLSVGPVGRVRTPARAAYPDKPRSPARQPAQARKATPRSARKRATAAA
jgi:antitoxin HicB